MEKRARDNSTLTTASNGDCVDTSKDDGSTLMIKLCVMMVVAQYNRKLQKYVYFT